MGHGKRKQGDAGDDLLGNTWVSQVWKFTQNNLMREFTDLGAKMCTLPKGDI